MSPAAAAAMALRRLSVTILSTTSMSSTDCNTAPSAARGSASPADPSRAEMVLGLLSLRRASRCGGNMLTRCRGCGAAQAQPRGQVGAREAMPGLLPSEETSASCLGSTSKRVHFSAQSGRARAHGAAPAPCCRRAQCRRAGRAMTRWKWSVRPSPPLRPSQQAPSASWRSSAPSWPRTGRSSGAAALPAAAVRARRRRMRVDASACLELRRRTCSPHRSSGDCGATRVSRPAVPASLSHRRHGAPGAVLLARQPDRPGVVRGALPCGAASGIV